MDAEICAIRIAVRESLSPHMARHGKHAARAAAVHARGEVRLPTCDVIVPEAVDVAGLRNRWSLRKRYWPATVDQTYAQSRRANRAARR